MTQKFLQGPCSRCGRTIRYPAQLIGTTGTCPMCRQQTEYVLEVPVQPSGIARRTLIYTLIAVFVLLMGLLGAWLALKSARNLRKPAEQTQLGSPAQYATVNKATLQL